MKRLGLIILLIALIFQESRILAQKKSTYEVNGTKYINGENYSTTGKPKVERSSSAKSEFLKTKGYSKEPKGYQVDHIIPLSEGGADTPSNMQLIPIEQHKRKTANERAKNSFSSTYRPSDYKSNSTYKNPSYKSKSTFKNSNYYSKPSYSNSSSKTIQTGPKGGQYYINSNGNKSYIKRK
jgi:hypothetical protein